MQVITSALCRHR